MMKKLLFLVTIQVVGFSAMAATTSPICDDMAKFACAPGEYNDGTGTSINPQYQSWDLSINTYDQVLKLANEKFAPVVADSKNAYFRALAISALGLSASPYCASSEAEQIKKCNESIVAGLSQMAVKEHSGRPEQAGSSGQSLTVGNISDKYLVSQSLPYKKVIGEIDKEVSAKFVDAESVNNIKNNVFVGVREALVERIKSLPIDRQKKQSMIFKVNGIEFAGTDCAEKSNSISRQFISNAFYNPLNNTFKICNAMARKGASEFQLAAVIAHELSHSIDPCGIQLGPDTMATKYSTEKDLEVMEKEYPLPGLISCLRSTNSVAAKNQTEQTLQKTAITESNSTTPPNRYGTYMAGYGVQTGKFDFCNGDQIGESVADWFAGETTAAYIQKKFPNLSEEQWQLGASNMFRPICNEHSSQQMMSAMDPHPEVQSRINSILLTQPNLRKKMGCPVNAKKSKHCSGEDVGLDHYVSRAGSYETANSVSSAGGGMYLPPAPTQPPTQVPGGQR